MEREVVLGGSIAGYLAPKCGCSELKPWKAPLLRLEERHGGGTSGDDSDIGVGSCRPPIMLGSESWESGK